MYLRGRPIIFYAPSSMMDSYDLNSVATAPSARLKLDWVTIHFLIEPNPTWSCSMHRRSRWRALRRIRRFKLKHRPTLILLPALPKKWVTLLWVSPAWA